MTDHDAKTDPAPPMPSLGERCVAWSLAEMRRAPVPSRDTLALWLDPCERGGRSLSLGDLVRSGRKLNHCAAAACAAAWACRDRTEMIPHRYRAAAKELIADALSAKAWHPVAEVRAGWRPAVGDLAIYDRSDPKRAETAWWGHVDRVTDPGPDDYENIGANEGPGGAWRLQRTRYDAPRLLGFVSYPLAVAAPVADLATLAYGAPETARAFSPEDTAHVLALGALTLDRAEAEWWESRVVVG